LPARTLTEPGKGPQVVRVERVVVHEGGQAIVGNVQPAASKVELGGEPSEMPAEISNVTISPRSDIIT
jgi:hypothetical protein